MTVIYRVTRAAIYRFDFTPSGGTPSDGPYGEAPPERGILFMLQV